jgi:hypothetical protein
MLQIVVSLEQSVTSEELDKDTSNTPDITWETPPQSKNDLRCSVVPGRYHARMIFIIKSSGAEINKTNVGIKQYSAGPTLTSGLGG